jgi:hypothetical protein
VSIAVTVLRGFNKYTRARCVVTAVIGTHVAIVALHRDAWHTATFAAALDAAAKKVVIAVSILLTLWDRWRQGRVRIDVDASLCPASV